MASCGVFLPSYEDAYENPIADVDGIGFSLFMGTASPLMIYLEVWHIILLSQFSFLSDKLLSEGIYFTETSATYSVTEFSSYDNNQQSSVIPYWHPELLVHLTSQTVISRSSLPVLVFINILCIIHPALGLQKQWFMLLSLTWNENYMQHSCPFWPFSRVWHVRFYWSNFLWMSKLFSNSFFLLILMFCFALQKTDVFASNLTG